MALPLFLRVLLELLVVFAIENRHLGLVFNAKTDQGLGHIVDDPVVVVEVNGEVHGLGSMGFCVDLDGVELDGPVRAETAFRLDNLVDHFKEVCASDLSEINILEDMVLDCPVLEVLDHANSQNGRSI